MFIAKDLRTNNVYFVDLERKLIELWNYEGETIKFSDTYSDEDLAKFMYNAMQYGWVKRTKE